MPADPTVFASLEKIFVNHNLAFSRATLLSVSGERDKKTVAALVQLLENKNLFFSFFSRLLQEETTSTCDSKVLFRESTPATLILEQYFVVHGSQFVCSILGPILSKARTYSKDVELNLVDDEVVREKRAEVIMKYSQKVLDSLNAQISQMPRQIAILLLIIYEEILKTSGLVQDDKQAKSFVFCVFFLHFICPALISPEKFRLYIVKTGESTKLVVKMARTLQTLANGSEFDNVYMQPLNKFIEINREPLDRFGEEILNLGRAHRDSFLFPALRGNEEFSQWKCIYRFVKRRHSNLTSILHVHYPAIAEEILLELDTSKKSIEQAREKLKSDSVEELERLGKAAQQQRSQSVPELPSSQAEKLLLPLALTKKSSAGKIPDFPSEGSPPRSPRSLTGRSGSIEKLPIDGSPKSEKRVGSGATSPISVPSSKRRSSIVELGASPKKTKKKLGGLYGGF